MLALLVHIFAHAHPMIAAGREPEARHYCGTGQFPHVPGPDCSEWATPVNCHRQG